MSKSASLYSVYTRRLECSENARSSALGRRETTCPWQRVNVYNLAARQRKHMVDGNRLIATQTSARVLFAVRLCHARLNLNRAEGLQSFTKICD